MEHNDLNLVPDSEYRVESLASRDSPLETVGIFKGITHIGSGVMAIVLDQKDGPRRIIPTHMILAIDIITVPKVEVEAEPEQKTYFR